MISGSTKNMPANVDGNSDMTTVYTLRDPATKQFYCLRRSSNENAEFCNDSTWTIGLYGDRLAEFATIEEVQRVLSINEDWYNSTEHRPTWGSDLSKAEVVEITRVETFKKINVKKLPVLDVGDNFVTDVPKDVVGTLKPTNDFNYFLGILRDGVYDWSKFINKSFYVGSRRVHGIKTYSQGKYSAIMVQPESY